MWKHVRDGAVVFGGVALGNYVSIKWVLKANPGDPGLILAANGWGADDLVTAAICTVAVVGLHLIIPR